MGPATPLTIPPPPCCLALFPHGPLAPSGSPFPAATKLSLVTDPGPFSTWTNLSGSAFGGGGGGWEAMISSHPPSL